MVTKNKKIRIGIVGIEGRMGKSIALAVLKSSGVELVSGIEHSNHKMLGKDIGIINGEKELGVKVTDNVDEFFKNLDVVIEFGFCLLYTSPSPRDGLLSRMPSSA